MRNVVSAFCLLLWNSIIIKFVKLTNRKTRKSSIRPPNGICKLIKTRVLNDI